MKNTPVLRPAIAAFASAALAGALILGCGGSGTMGANGASSASTSTALSAALASSSASSGTLLCTPAQAQIDACTSKASGATCTLSSTTNGVTTTVDGTCRTTLDGATVACSPNPPAPPQELVAACAAKASGDACTVTEAFGDTRSGTCIAARDSSTLVCGRVQTPPQAAIDACTSHAAGDTCTLTGGMGHGTMSGVCSLGPASTGPLACAPAHDLLPNGQAACTGLAVGAACSIGMGHDAKSGSCVMPAGGTSAVCVPSCADLGGRFQCGPPGAGGPGGPTGGPGGPSGPMGGPGGPSGPMGH